MNNDLITIGQLTEALDISEVTVHRWKKNGCPYYKIPDKKTLRYNIFFKLTEVTAWIDKKQTKRGE